MKKPVYIPAIEAMNARESDRDFIRNQLALRVSMLAIWVVGIYLLAS
jgi:hypothetical protein